MADDLDRGLYRKYRVSREDGRSLRGQKHDACDYFVLDMVHDVHAYAAIRAYADACAEDYPALARDLRAKYLATHFMDSPRETPTQ
jgi:hypothetical protein